MYESAPTLPTETELRDRFRFTRQESRVALLLASGLPNTEVARTLCVSPHTTRHHTERVLLRLGVHSRAQVAMVLFTGRPPGARTEK